MLNLDYHSIAIEKSETTSQIVIKGEVTNNSGKSYAAVAVRIVLFIKNICIGNAVFMINGLPKGATKAFAKIMDDLEYDQIAKDITHYEIYTDSCY